MASTNSASVLDLQQEYLLPGRNALETSLELAQNWLPGARQIKLIETVKQILQTLDRNQVPYAVIGGLAVSHHAVPRLTQDMDLVIPHEHAAKMRTLFPDCYQKGTAVVEVYRIGGVRVDVLPAKLRYQRAVVADAVEGEIEGTRARVACVRDLVLLKMFAAPNRPELRARKQDETDITALLEMNTTQVTAADIRYVGDRLLELCFTAEDRDKTVQQIKWLNDTLTQLVMTDRCYPLPG